MSEVLEWCADHTKSLTVAAMHQSWCTSADKSRSYKRCKRCNGAATVRARGQLLASQQGDQLRVRPIQLLACTAQRAVHCTAPAAIGSCITGAPGLPPTLPVLWLLGGVLEQGHALRAVVPQEGGVVQPAAPGDGLRVAPNLAVPEHIVCGQAHVVWITVRWSEVPGCMPGAAAAGHQPVHLPSCTSAPGKWSSSEMAASIIGAAKLLPRAGGIIAAASLTIFSQGKGAMWFKGRPVQLLSPAHDGRWKGLHCWQVLCLRGAAAGHRGSAAGLLGAKVRELEGYIIHAPQRQRGCAPCCSNTQIARCSRPVLGWCSAMWHPCSCEGVRGASWVLRGLR